jgi:2-polyprenyl-3-methyl-5-hydroxy-6-metoxy-1,4-benzoquinol methylase
VRNLKTVKKCRICYSTKLSKIFDFGKVFLSGNIINKPKKDKKYPLSLLICKNCKHIQIGYLVKPDLLFKNYLWETGVSNSNIILIENLLKILKEKYQLNSKKKLFEVACNDGTLLKICNKKYKNFTSGIDPAKNLTKKNKKLNIITNYFNSISTKKIEKKFGRFDFVIARNVLAHVLNPNEIIDSANILLKQNGILVIEVPSLKTIFKENQYDNIFHEHIGFHSLHSIKLLCSQKSMKIIDVEEIESQGKSLRCYITKNSNPIKISKVVNVVLKKEKFLLKIKTWKRFEKKIKRHVKQLNKVIVNIKKKNKTISAYGASGKGQSLIQICEIGKYINFIYDKSKLKNNKFSPGYNIKILHPKKIKDLRPDYLLLLTWNIKAEILKQERKFRDHGGKFIIPFPTPHIL